MPAQLPRSQARAHFDQPTRISLVENDLDVLETQIDDLRDTMNARFDKADARQGKIMATCLAILTSLIVASVMLALNLAVR